MEDPLVDSTLPFHSRQLIKDTPENSLLCQGWLQERANILHGYEV